MPGGGLGTVGGISKTENHDTFAGAGSCTGAFIIATEIPDSPAISGTFTASASISATEGRDTSGFTATDVAIASLSATEGHDSASLSATDIAFGSISLAGGNDSAAAAGILTAIGSLAHTEAHDSPSLAGSFSTAASASITAGNDTASITGICGSLGSISKTESADTPSISATFTAAATIGIAMGDAANDTPAISGNFIASASIGATEGPDSLAGFSSSLEYQIYSNTGIGDPINYGSAIGTTGLLDWTSSPLTYPGTWSFGVRAFNPVTTLEEQNIDCTVTIILDANGNDITNRPKPPTALRAFATAGGGIKVEWSYNLINPNPIPTGFRVYIGIGSPNYAAPAATISFQSSMGGIFFANIGRLLSGKTYSVGVRAYNATAEEPNTNTTTVTIASVGPSAVQSLTATAVV